MKYPVLLMESVQKITEGFESLLTDRKKKKLAGYMQKLGFEDISTTFYKLNPESGKKVDKKLSTETILRPIKKDSKTNNGNRSTRFHFKIHTKKLEQGF